MAVNMKRRYSGDESSQEPERKRSAQACLPCRKKKMRCDGTKPTCSHCAKLGLECGYNQNRKPGLQPGYVARLQNRIVELEALLEEQNQALRQARHLPSPFDERRQSISSSDQSYFIPPMHRPSSQYPYSSTSDGQEAMNTQKTEEYKTARRRDTTGLDNLAHVAATSPPAVSPPASDRPRQNSNSDIDPNLGYAAVSFPTFPHDIFISGAQSYATPSRQTEAGSPAPALDNSVGALLPYGSEAEGLPPKEILDIMIDLYFQYIHPTFPILHKATFLSSILLPPALRPESSIILRAIVVCTASHARFHSRLEKHAEALTTSYSMDGAFHHKIIDHALDQPSLKTLQALAILALSYVASGSTERLFGVVAILTRLAMSLSLHNMDSSPQCEDNPKCTSTRASFIETEERRRCFWAIYLLDQFASTSSSCPISQWRNKIQTELPSSETDFQMSRDGGPRSDKFKVDAWAHCVESAGVLGRVVEWTQAKFEGSHAHGRAMAKQLEERWNRLPESIRLPIQLTKSDAGNIILLHASHNTALILLFQALSHDTAHGTRMELREAVSRLGRVANFVNNSPDLIPHVSPIVPLCFLFALRHLCSKDASDARDAFRDEISELKTALAKLGPVYPLAEKAKYRY